MAGYEFTVDHRMGGEDGPTEWSFTSRIPAIMERILKLEKLKHPLLCAFSVTEDYISYGFCIRQDAPASLFIAVVHYLGCWPEEEKKKLERINRIGVTHGNS